MVLGNGGRRNGGDDSFDNPRSLFDESWFANRPSATRARLPLVWSCTALLIFQLVAFIVAWIPDFLWSYSILQNPLVSSIATMLSVVLIAPCVVLCVLVSKKASTGRYVSVIGGVELILQVIFVITMFIVHR
jgi:hypothetical protein